MFEFEDELKERIAELEAEIKRLREALTMIESAICYSCICSDIASEALAGEVSGE